MASGFANIGKIPELRRRILFTLAMLAVYRIGVFVTIPGVNRAVMKHVVRSRRRARSSACSTCSRGGALEQLSIFALGIMPYVSASHHPAAPDGGRSKPLDELRKEGEQGRRKINQYTRYGTVVLSLVQSFGIARWLEGEQPRRRAVRRGRAPIRAGASELLTMITLTTGTAFIMWLGEQITERGIGNGISLIIFAGIVAGIPDARRSRMFANGRDGEHHGLRPGCSSALHRGRGRRGHHLLRARRSGGSRSSTRERVVGRKMSTAGRRRTCRSRSTSRGVIPPIFASSILMFPAQLAELRAVAAGCSRSADALQPGRLALQHRSTSALIIFFCYFYTAVTFNPVDVADNMKKHGGFIPGIRPGKQTAEYIDQRAHAHHASAARSTSSAVCVLPSLHAASSSTCRSASAARRS